MTCFAQVLAVGILGVLIGLTCLPFGSTMVFAQGASCTAPPPAPPNAAATVTVAGTSARPATIPPVPIIRETTSRGRLV